MRGARLGRAKAGEEGLSERRGLSLSAFEFSCRVSGSAAPCPVSFGLRQAFNAALRRVSLRGTRNRLLLKYGLPLSFALEVQGAPPPWPRLGDLAATDVLLQVLEERVLRVATVNRGDGGRDSLSLFFGALLLEIVAEIDKHYAQQCRQRQQQEAASAALPGGVLETCNSEPLRVVYVRKATTAVALQALDAGQAHMTDLNLVLSQNPFNGVTSCSRYSRSEQVMTHATAVVVSAESEIASLNSLRQAILSATDQRGRTVIVSNLWEQQNLARVLPLFTLYELALDFGRGAPLADLLSAGDAVAALDALPPVLDGPSKLRVFYGGPSYAIGAMFLLHRNSGECASRRPSTPQFSAAGNAPHSQNSVATAINSTLRGKPGEDPALSSLRRELARRQAEYSASAGFTPGSAAESFASALGHPGYLAGGSSGFSGGGARGGALFGEHSVPGTPGPWTHVGASTPVAELEGQDLVSSNSNSRPSSPAAALAPPSSQSAEGQQPPDAFFSPLSSAPSSRAASPPWASGGVLGGGASSHASLRATEAAGRRRLYLSTRALHDAYNAALAQLVGSGVLDSFIEDLQEVGVVPFLDCGGLVPASATRALPDAAAVPSDDALWSVLQTGKILVGVPPQGAASALEWRDGSFDSPRVLAEGQTPPSVSSAGRNSPPPWTPLTPEAVLARRVLREILFLISSHFNTPISISFVPFESASAVLRALHEGKIHLADARLVYEYTGPQQPLEFRVRPTCSLGASRLWQFTATASGIDSFEALFRAGAAAAATATATAGGVGTSSSGVLTAQTAGRALRVVVAVMERELLEPVEQLFLGDVKVVLMGAAEAATALLEERIQAVVGFKTLQRVALRRALLEGAATARPVEAVPWRQEPRGFVKVEGGTAARRSGFAPVHPETKQLPKQQSSRDPYLQLLEFEGIAADEADEAQQGESQWLDVDTGITAVLQSFVAVSLGAQRRGS